jgi:Anti-sigma factor NepR
MIIMSEKTKPEQVAIAQAGDPPEQVPDWLGGRLRRMVSELMDEPVPDEFKALLKQLEDKERGS